MLSRLNKSQTRWYSSQQNVVTTPTRHRVGNVFCMISRRCRTTSPKHLADKPHHKQTNHQALQRKTSNEGRENSQLQDIQGQGGGQECLWNISWNSQGTTDHHGAEAKSCEGYCINVGGTT